MASAKNSLTSNNRPSPWHSNYQQITHPSTKNLGILSLTKTSHAGSINPMPAHPQSYEKIIERYFPPICTQQFEFKGVVYRPKTLKINPSIFVRRMTCVEKCAACCPKFTLDFLPDEKQAWWAEEDAVAARHVEFNGEQILIYSDVQEANTDYYCHRLNKDRGLCGIHGKHPMSCDFECLRFRRIDDPKRDDQLAHAPFGRGWNMTKIDGTKGVACEWYDKPCDNEWKEELIRKLTRLRAWADHFKLPNKVPTIIDWIQRGPHQSTGVIGPPTQGGFGLV